MLTQSYHFDSKTTTILLCLFTISHACVAFMWALSLSLSPSLTHIHSVNGCSDPLLSPTRHKYSSETPENDAVSYSDAESDSGFESGTHTFISTATNCSHNEFVAVGKSEESESDEDERIEKAILHLDVKVCAHVCIIQYHTFVLMTSKQGDIV